jgi:hypothetical protein
LGIGLTFGVSGIFTHVAESTWLWSVPVAALLCVLTARWRATDWPRRNAWIQATAVAVVVVATFWSIGAVRSARSIRGSKHLVVIGRGNPTLWVVANRAVLGEQYGKTLRRCLAEGKGDWSAIALVDSMADLPTWNVGTIVVSGALTPGELGALESRRDLCEALVFLNPLFYPLDLGARAALPSPNVKVIFGEFSQSPTLSAWEEVASVRQIPAVGDFLPCWPELVVVPGS